MDRHESPRARGETADPSPKPREREPGGLLSAIVLAAAAVVLLGGLGAGVFYLLSLEKKGPKGPPPRTRPEGVREIATIEAPLEELLALAFTGSCT
jgi:hypothetical protein